MSGTGVCHIETHANSPNASYPYTIGPIVPCCALRWPSGGPPASPSQSNQSHPNHSLIIDLTVQSTINTIQTILIIDFLVLLTYSIGATTSQGRFPKACKVVPLGGAMLPRQNSRNAEPELQNIFTRSKTSNQMLPEEKCINRHNFGT